MTEEQIRNTWGMLIKLQSSLMRELTEEELKQYMITFKDDNSIKTISKEEDNNG